MTCTRKTHLLRFLKANNLFKGPIRPEHTKKKQHEDVRPFYSCKRGSKSGESYNLAKKKNPKLDYKVIIPVDTQITETEKKKGPFLD